MGLPDVFRSDTYTTVPSTTPDKMFRFSDHINDDRQIFSEKTFHALGESDSYRNIHLPFRGVSTSVPKIRLSLHNYDLEVKGRFNEPLNTYVDTRKRISRFHSLDNLNKSFSYELPGLDDREDSDRSKDTTSLLLTGRPALKTKDSSEIVELPNIDKQLEQSSTSFPFRLHKSADTRPKLFQKMPQRISLKPTNIWKQRTDILLRKSDNYGTPRKLKFKA